MQGPLQEQEVNVFDDLEGFWPIQTTFVIRGGTLRSGIPYTSPKTLT